MLRPVRLPPVAPVRHRVRPGLDNALLPVGAAALTIPVMLSVSLAIATLAIALAVPALLVLAAWILALPLALGLGFILLPLTSGATSVGLVAALMGLGNGISSGIVLTLGADASPGQERAQFLAGWRLCSDLGNAAGPLLISAVSAIATLAAAAVTMGLITWAGSAWLIKWVPVYAARPHRQSARREAQEP